VMYCEDPLYCKCLCIHFTCKAYIKTAVTECWVLTLMLSIDV